MSSVMSLFCTFLHSTSDLTTKFYVILMYGLVDLNKMETKKPRNIPER